MLVYSLVKHGASKQTMVSKMRGIPSTIFIVETTGGTVKAWLVVLPPCHPPLTSGNGAP